MKPTDHEQLLEDPITGNFPSQHQPMAKGLAATGHPGQSCLSEGRQARAGGEVP